MSDILTYMVWSVSSDHTTILCRISATLWSDHGAKNLVFHMLEESLCNFNPLSVLFFTKCKHITYNHIQPSPILYS